LQEAPERRLRQGCVGIDDDGVFKAFETMRGRATEAEEAPFGEDPKRAKPPPLIMEKENA
jgi:hypothetical protein